MKTILFIFAIGSLGGCATIDPRGSYGAACGVNYLNEPTIAQLDCMDQKGKNDPNYRPDTKKRAYIEGIKRKEHDQMMAQVWLTSERRQNPIGGTVRAPINYPEIFVNERISGYCSRFNKPSWNVTEVKQVKEYVGQGGGASMYCNQYGCFGGNNSTAKYISFSDILFECSDSAHLSEN